MRELNIDIETYSSVPIKESGAYKYAQSPDFEILMLAYSVDGGAVQQVDFTAGETLPEEIVAALADPIITKRAYNAAFEWYCLNRAGYETPLSSWRCTMALGLYYGYPAGLGAIGAALGLSADDKKDAAGKALIRYFSVPCAPTKSNGGRTRNLPEHAPERWAVYKAYNRQDVWAEVAVLDALPGRRLPDREQLLWEMDVAMAARGIAADRVLIDRAILMDGATKAAARDAVQKKTGIDNINSVPQLLDWFRSNGMVIDNVRKETLLGLLDDDRTPDTVRMVIEARLGTAKTSVAKYEAMAAVMCEDGRLRGLLQYYGANRTGRWAGRLVQVHNLYRNSLPTLDEARALVLSGQREAVELLYGGVPEVLSQLVRTAFVPAKDKFVVCDFSAIEARVIAWLAGEEWVSAVFRSHGKIYEATAAQMFNVPIEEIAPGQAHYGLRQKGKIAQLALGYQGSVGALKAMGALKMGLTEDELPDIVQRWRAANPNIVALWRKLERAARTFLRTGEPQSVGPLRIHGAGDASSGAVSMVIDLPSGRALYYPGAALVEDAEGRERITYMTEHRTRRTWTREETYGGKLAENVVQAIARDCLAESLIRLSRGLTSCDIVMHVHDEVVLDCPAGVTPEQVRALMCAPIDWAPGLVLDAAGFESAYYKKD